MAKKVSYDINVFQVRRINRRWVVVSKQFLEEFIYCTCRTRSIANAVASDLNYREMLYIHDRRSNWSSF